MALRRGKKSTEPVVANVITAAGTAVGEPALRNTALAQHAVVAGVAAHEAKVRLNLERLIKPT